MAERNYQNDRDRGHEKGADAGDFRRYRGSEGTYDGNYYGSRLPRYGRQYGYGEDFDQGYRDETMVDDGYARYADSGYYPSDHPFERGGYARTAYPYQRSFRGSGTRDGEGYYGERREDNSHRGKGPRGYQRADERIEEDVNDRLSDDPQLDATDIEVSVDASEVTLNGQVANRRDKRRAEDCAESVSGVTNVQNNLRVREQARTASSGDMRPA